MSPEDKVSKVFNKFVGCEVRMKTLNVTEKCLRGKLYKALMGTTPFPVLPYTVTKPCLTDPTMLKMRFTAWVHFRRLFVEYPAHEDPLHFPFVPPKTHPRRVNAGIEQGKDGKWRVCGDFGLG